MCAFLNCVDPLRSHSLWLLVGLCTVSCMYGGFISVWMEIWIYFSLDGNFCAVNHLIERLLICKGYSCNLDTAHIWFG